jgi:hypothetical protein
MAGARTAAELAALSALSLAPDASSDQVKRQYMELARKLHPDKNPASNSQEKFVAVRQAWEVLSCEAGAGLSAAPCETAVDVDLDDLRYDAVHARFLHTCRCRDLVAVPVDSLDAGFDEFACPSCSLRIHVLFDRVALED